MRNQLTCKHVSTRSFTPGVIHQVYFGPDYGREPEPGPGTLEAKSSTCLAHSGMMVNVTVQKLTGFNIHLSLTAEQNIEINDQILTLMIY